MVLVHVDVRTLACSLLRLACPLLGKDKLSLFRKRQTKSVILQPAAEQRPELSPRRSFCEPWATVENSVGAAERRQKSRPAERRVCEAVCSVNVFDELMLRLASRHKVAGPASGSDRNQEAILDYVMSTWGARRLCCKSIEELDESGLPLPSAERLAFP